MFDDAGRVVFGAFAAAAAERLGPEHACTAALAAAAERPEPAQVAAAQAALVALAEDERVEVARRAHAALAGNPLAWLSLWPGGGPPRQ